MSGVSLVVQQESTDLGDIHKKREVLNCQSAVPYFTCSALCHLVTVRHVGHYNLKSGSFFSGAQFEELCFFQ